MAFFVPAHFSDKELLASVEAASGQDRGAIYLLRLKLSKPAAEDDQPAGVKQKRPALSFVRCFNQLARDFAVKARSAFTLFTLCNTQSKPWLLPDLARQSL